MIAQKNKRENITFQTNIGVKLNVMIVSSPVTCNSFVSSASTSMSSRGVVVDVRSRRDRYVMCGWRVVSGSCWRNVKSAASHHEKRDHCDL